jgi:hypothetical protein
MTRAIIQQVMRHEVCKGQHRKPRAQATPPVHRISDHACGRSVDARRFRSSRAQRDATLRVATHGSPEYRIQVDGKLLSKLARLVGQGPETMP